MQQLLNLLKPVKEEQETNMAGAEGREMGQRNVEGHVFWWVTVRMWLAQESLGHKGCENLSNWTILLDRLMDPRNVCALVPGFFWKREWMLLLVILKITLDCPDGPRVFTHVFIRKDRQVRWWVKEGAVRWLSPYRRIGTRAREGVMSCAGLSFVKVTERSTRDFEQACQGLSWLC